MIVIIHNHIIQNHLKQLQVLEIKLNKIIYNIAEVKWTQWAKDGCSQEAQVDCATLRCIFLCLWWKERLGKLLASNKVFNHFTQMFQSQFRNFELETSLLYLLCVDVKMPVVQQLLKEEATMTADKSLQRTVQAPDYNWKCVLISRMLEVGMWPRPFLPACKG